MVKAIRPIYCVDGIKPQHSVTLAVSYWKDILLEIQQGTYGKQEEEGDENKCETDVLPATAFNNPPLVDFLTVICPGIKVEVRIHDYDAVFADKKQKIYWICSILKVCGYMLLLRYEGMDQEGDEKHDFWMNVGSTDLRHVGFCAFEENCDLIPPAAIRKRHEDWSRYMLCKLHACKTLTGNWPNEQHKLIISGRFWCGQRLELLDRLESTRVRPARIVQQLGRRILLRISEDDMPAAHLPSEDDLQIRDGVWVDEGSCLIFPVGWAKHNNYGLLANDAYVTHCEKIVKAMKEGKKPEYGETDVTYAQFKDWYENKNSENPIHWKVGWKFECLDPLNMSFLELRVATCVETLNDGYLKIGFDGPEMEEELLPIHCTSPLLFPIGYGSEYDIRVRGPSETFDFSWKEYLRQCQATPAPAALFDPLPPPETLKKFEIGSKLEATDMCEPHLICPATVVGIKGRLLRIHFDGWEEDIDQLFDYRSHDIFPVGWCEMYGYKMELPRPTLENGNRLSSAKKSSRKKPRRTGS